MQEYTLRLTIFLLIILCMSVSEYLIPYRKRILSRKDRWPGNLLLPVISSIMLKFIFPLTAVGFANWVSQNKLGLFHQFEFKNNLLIQMISFFILDFAIYLQHIISHKWKPIWKLHRVHHFDPDLDFTSGIRFHPIEIFLSQVYKFVWILVLGIPAPSVVIFEIVLNAMAMFNHSNLYIPNWLETKLRLFFVTPQMHIIHHSVERIDHDSNYGFNFSFWDRIFGTYRDKFSYSDKIGLTFGSSGQEQSLWNLLAVPFKKSP